MSHIRTVDEHKSCELKKENSCKKWVVKKFNCYSHFEKLMSDFVNVEIHILAFTPRQRSTQEIIQFYKPLKASDIIARFHLKHKYRVTFSKRVLLKKITFS